MKLIRPGAAGKKTGGRQRGTLNKVTVEARALCAGIVEDPIYQAQLRQRALAGKLAPAIETMMALRQRETH